MPSSRPSSPSPVCKPRRCQSRSTSHGRERSQSTGNSDDRRKRRQSPSPPQASDKTCRKQCRSRSRDDDCWGVHPELPYITHSHNSRCLVCTEYGAHLALASAAQLRTYQHARYDLVYLQDRLLQRRSIEDVDRMLRHAEADNKDLRSDNACLQEENNKLKARLASMGPLQPQYSTTDAPLQAPSSFRGRAQEQEHPQRQSMGYPPTTHHHDTQGKLPTHEDTCLMTSRPAPHEPAHEAFSSMELDEPRESCPLYERFSNSEKTLDEIEGQLFPEFDGTECPRTVRILGEE